MATSLTSRNMKVQMALAGLTTLLMLAGCGFFGPGEARPGASPEPGYQAYQDTWTPGSIPKELATLTAGQVTLHGRCEFQAEWIKARDEGMKGILFPMLQFSDSGFLTPDAVSSRSVYKALSAGWSLNSPVDSLQLYQRWVSSVEHACPDHLNRELSQCSLKGLFKLGRFTHSGSHYDLDRLNNWLEGRRQVGYLVIPNLELLKTKAVLNLKYSSQSPAISQLDSAERRALVSPYMTRLSLDWVLLNHKHHLESDQFDSVGKCLIYWKELEGDRAEGGLPEMTVQQQLEVNQLLKTELSGFLNKAIKSQQLFHSE